jgi:putative transposase
MARLPRLYAPNVAQLAQARFAHPLAGPGDAAPAAELDLLEQWLRDSAREARVAVHGWVLMADGVTLLATAPTAEAMSRMMQAFGRRYASRLRHGRVFAGRYRSTLVQAKGWVLPVLVWLETLPVVAGLVDQAQTWPWSSAAGHVGRDARRNGWLNDHPDYWQGGDTPFARQAAYQQELERGLGEAQRQRIEKAIFGQWALGDAAFVTRLATTASRRVAPAPRGRPRKKAASAPAGAARVESTAPEH